MVPTKFKHIISGVSFYGGRQGSPASACRPAILPQNKAMPRAAKGRCHILPLVSVGGLPPSPSLQRYVGGGSATDSKLALPFVFNLQAAKRRRPFAACGIALFRGGRRRPVTLIGHHTF